jgi:hypothetical protein
MRCLTLICVIILGWFTGVSASDPLMPDKAPHPKPHVHTTVVQPNSRAYALTIKTVQLIRTHVTRENIEWALETTADGLVSGSLILFWCAAFCVISAMELFNVIYDCVFPPKSIRGHA